MVQINHDIKSCEYPCFLYSPDGEFIGQINNYEQYLDVKLQIKEQQVSGYYVSFCGDIVKLDKNGTEDHFPDGFWGDKMSNLLIQLI